jgi:hypothetical protein
LLVVLVIVAVLVASIAWSVGGTGSRELERVAERTRRLIELACERAEIGGRDIGFAPLRDRLQFGYFEREGWRPFGPRGDDELRARDWGDAIALRAMRDGDLLELEETPPEAPPYACLASGELTPFEWELARADVPESWTLKGGLDGAITLARNDDAR